ncbi:MAG: serine--tRNA ligase, partial [Acidobacteria bacterium]|nr:serine--tRNA ligase [Acidobacteriota bacterium]
MLEMAWVRDHLDVLEKALRDRGAGVDLGEFKRLDDERRGALREVERLKASRNKVSEQIAALKKDRKDAASLIEEMRAVGDRIKVLDAAVDEREAALASWLLAVPNVPHQSVPVGHSPGENVEVRRWGRTPAFDFRPAAHWDLGAALGILDFERAAKIAGARFAVYM